MKKCYILDTIGDNDLFHYTLYNELLDRGFRILILTSKENFNDGDFDFERVEGIEIIQLPKITFTIIGIFVFFKWIKKIFRQYEIVALLLKERNLKSTLFSVIAKKYQAKVIIATDMGYPYWDAYVRKKFFALRRIIFDILFTNVILASTQQAYMFHLLRKDKVLFIPYSPFHEPEKRVIENKQSNITSFIFIGQLIQRKNIILTLNILKRLSEKYKNMFTLDVIGEGNLSGHISSYSNFFKIKFHGKMCNKEIYSILKRSDMLLLLSQYDTFGIPVVEALSAGVPVLVSDRVGASMSHVIDGFNGYIVNTNNIDEVYSKLEEFLLSKELRDSFKNNSFNLYNIPQLASKLAVFIESILK